MPREAEYDANNGSQTEAPKQTRPVGRVKSVRQQGAVGSKKRDRSARGRATKAQTETAVVTGLGPGLASVELLYLLGLLATQIARLRLDFGLEASES